MLSTRRLNVLAIVAWLALSLSAPAQAQTFTVLHNFTGGSDGGQPYVGLTMDEAGNLYGAALAGGTPGGCSDIGCGVLFRMTHKNSSWTLTPLYTFSGGSDGAWPDGRVVFGPDGTLYGSTFAGGNSYGASGTGVIFNLQPPARVTGRLLSPWTETVLYRFGGVEDGNNPSGDLVFDSSGNIYGTTQSGGYECEDTVTCGTVFEVAHNGGGWTESILYEFMDGAVAIPRSGVIFDHLGNLYGTVTNGAGAVFELTHSGWTENTLHYFGEQGDGSTPIGGLIFDPAGNLYGTTQLGGANGAGTVYEMSLSDGRWGEEVLYSLTTGGESYASLARDAAGNLYGTTCDGGVDHSGSVFKLTPLGDSWTETDLHDFNVSDGACPMGNVILDSSGNIYGTTFDGGAHGWGTVFEITP
jgi:uncharacterized repeat protein (TIGR03803 family)